MTDGERIPGLEASAPSDVRTFLFADIRGYTRFTVECGDEAAARLAARFAHLARDGVTNHGGHVIELRGDEALAVFSSPRQAVRAAVELQSRFTQESRTDPVLPLHVGMGLDAGEAVPVEGGYRGGALNLAARLCSLAGPGEILLSETVAALTRKIAGLEYLARGMVEIKGFSDPLRIVQVTSGTDHTPVPRDVARSQNELDSQRAEQSFPIGAYLGSLPADTVIGRDEEVARIEEIVDAVAEGNGQLVLLVGEPGVGKTRLAQEVTLSVRKRGFLVATGRCYEPDGTVPYYPFLDLLATAFHAAPRSVRARAAHQWPYLASVIPEQFAGPQMPRASTPGEQQRLLRAVTGFLEAIATIAPVALMVDDLHWADGATLRLLLHLARHTVTSRILLLGTYRDVEVVRGHPLADALHDLSREGLVERVRIRGLTISGTSALISAVLGEMNVSDDFAELIHRKTEGNPFFVQQVLRMLVERGDVYQEDKQWSSRTVRGIEVPESVRPVIAQRLSRLSHSTRELLAQASVLGQTFHCAELAELAARTDEEVDTSLSEATTRGLVRDIGNDVYTFDHALTQETLYEELGPRRRKRLHLAAGDALEHVPAREREARAAELSRHFTEGGDSHRALPYVILAGELAEAVFAHSEAEWQYRTALAFARKLSDAPREAEALEKLGRVLRMQSRYEEAFEHLDAATRVYGRLGNREGEARATAQIGHVRSTDGHINLGIARVQTLLQELKETAPTPGLAALAAALVRLRLMEANITADHTLQLVAAEEAAAIARAVGDELSLVGAEIGRAAALGHLGQRDEGLKVVENAIRQAEAIGDLESLARVLANAANEYHIVGDRVTTKQYRERSLAVAKRVGEPRLTTIALQNLAEHAWQDGLWSESRMYAEQADTLIRSVEPIGVSARPALWLARLDLLEGKFDLVDYRSRDIVTIAEKQGGTNARTTLLNNEWLLAEKDIATGFPEAALARLLPLMSEPELSRDVAIRGLLVRVHLALDNVADAGVAAAEAVDIARTGQDAPVIPDAVYIQGTVAVRTGDWPAAQRLFEEARTQTWSLHPYGEALILHQYGLMRLAQGDYSQAREECERAAAIFRQLGALPDLERTLKVAAEIDKIRI